MCAAVCLGDACYVIAASPLELDSRPAQFSLTGAWTPAGSALARDDRWHGHRGGNQCRRYPRAQAWSRSTGATGRAMRELTRPAVASSLASYRRRAADASAGAVNACRGAGSRLHRLMGPQPALTRRRSVKRGALSRTTGATRWVKRWRFVSAAVALAVPANGRSLPVGITALGVQPCMRDRGFRRSGPRLHLMRQASRGGR
jgi:hypothetical protein